MECWKSGKLECWNDRSMGSWGNGNFLLELFIE
jgi:hypothetical protein